MKLYYTSGACSLATHIAFKEAGLAFDAVSVDLKVKKTVNGADYLAINPKGAVPAIGLDNGETLTEVAVTLQYVADQKPGAHLIPAAGTLARYRVLEWLNYIASELHKGFNPLWNPKNAKEVKQAARDGLAAKFDFLSKALAGKTFLMGEGFTVADAYLYTILNWGQWTGIEVAKWPALAAYMARVAARPGVRAALVAEGLAK
ncbi:MAG: glutathione transferase GstA [Alphaproteobacteria bacterium]|nr:glutathione transferase GstA [Alphaproteobacteria bacterium]